jgi:hypothetical protein
MTAVASVSVIARDHVEACGLVIEVALLNILVLRLFELEVVFSFSESSADTNGFHSAGTFWTG